MIVLGDVRTSANAVTFPSALSAELCLGWPGPRNHPVLALWKISGLQLQTKRNRSSITVSGHEAGPADSQAAVPCLSLARHLAQQPLS